MDQEIEKHGKDFGTLHLGLLLKAFGILINFHLVKVSGKIGDFYLTALFFKAVLFKQTGNFIEAQQYLKAIVNQ